jgi:hypothetical protein
MSEANPKGYNFQVRVTSGHEAEAKAGDLLTPRYLRLEGCAD